MRKYSKEHVGKTANKVPAVIAVVCFFVVGVGVRAQQEEQVPVIILYHTMPDQANELAVETQGGVVKSRYHLIPAIAATLPESVLERVQNSPNVRLVEPDFQLFPDDNLPNDPRFAEQWSLKNTGQTGGTPGADIDAPKAWDTTTGSSNVVVAVIDTGAQIAPGVSGSLQTHPDLAANLWTNPGEIPNDNIDNDGNGYVDDLHGWNFFDGESWLFYSASEDDHGTHVSGTIAAAGNNGIGITGVNWQAQLMILKFIGPAGGSTSDSILAIQYARDKGAKVINASWGGTGFSQALKDAVDACDCVFAAAAGNEETNTDTAPHYPSSFDSANLIAVAATDHKDQRPPSPTTASRRWILVHQG